MPEITFKAFIGDDEVEVTADYTPGDPGNTCGLPENCWPPEPPEIEILSVCLVDDGDDLIPALTDKEIEFLYNKAFEVEVDYDDLSADDEHDYRDDR